jgi:hypothetical protein
MTGYSPSPLPFAHRRIFCDNGLASIVRLIGAALVRSRLILDVERRRRHIQERRSRCKIIAAINQNPGPNRPRPANVFSKRGVPL